MELLIVLMIAAAIYFIIGSNKDEELEEYRPTANQIISIENEIDNIVNSAYETSSDKWDYKIADNLSQSQLSELGQKGWELVGITTYETGGGIFANGIGSSRYTVQIRYALKRRIIKNNRENEIVALREKANELRAEFTRKQLENKKKNDSDILAEEREAKKTQN